MGTGGGGQVVTGAAASGSSGVVPPGACATPGPRAAAPGQSPRPYDVPGPCGVRRATKVLPQGVALTCVLATTRPPPSEATATHVLPHGHTASGLGPLPPGLHPPGIPSVCLSVCPSQSVCPVSAPWRTWTTSVQNTLGQSGEGGLPTGPAHSLEESKLLAGTLSTDFRGASPPQPGLPPPASTPGTHRRGPRQVSPRTPLATLGNPRGPGVDASCEAVAPADAGGVGGGSSPEQPAPHRQAQGLGLEPCVPGSVLPAGQREDTGSCSAPHLKKDTGWMGLSNLTEVAPRPGRQGRRTLSSRDSPGHPGAAMTASVW